MNVQPISISLVGTTSCGKSTVGNVLSGRFLFPTGVQETTTSVIELHHIPNKPRDTLFFNDHQMESHVEGPDDFLSAQVAEHMSREAQSSRRLRLHASFRASHVLFYDPGDSKKRVVPCPNLYGIRKYSLKLPLGYSFVLQDAPGFSHQVDLLRSSIIQDLCSTTDAVLFIYNAEETDCIKEEALLSVLLHSCYQNGIPLTRFLFLVNRIDAFLRDQNAESRLEEWLSDRRSRLKRLVSGIYGPSSITPEIIPICAEPMAYSEAMFWFRHWYFTSSEQDHYLEQLRHWVRKLLSDEELETLPRSPRKWSWRNWKTVCLGIRRVSNYEVLHKNLQDLIDQVLDTTAI